MPIEESPETDGICSALIVDTAEQAFFRAIIDSLALSGPARVPLVRPHRRPPAMHRIGKAAIMRP
ncbi:MAG: hypothetical protein M3Y58_11930 [Chloroflexota bacterium]|nr:hypothetical protein [Chloroflexota bacterium]